MGHDSSNYGQRLRLGYSARDQPRLPTLKKRLASGVDGPVAFRTRLIDVIDYSDCAPWGPALETLQTFAVPSGTPFEAYLRSFRVVVASTVDKGGPFVTSPERAMELIRIYTSQQYPVLMPTLFPSNSDT